MLEQLIHNGVVIPDPPTYRGLQIQVRGKWLTLTPKQEEMALAWAKKQGTEYVEDPVFVENFMADFSAALDLEPPLTLDEVDFTPVVEAVEAERAIKEQRTPEERKELAARRKAKREELQERYAQVIVNGEQTELASYVVEPSSIFMGRGQHPLRGRWKQGANQEDVTLNLSPDAPRPEGEWKKIVWRSDAMWVARWRDKLSGKLKYIWLSDTASVKQEREAEKFDQAIELHEELDRVRSRIQADLRHEKPRWRMVATACYLIDALCLRVGDEKEADEADTVGATTLRPEHVTLHPDGKAEFKFLGKDSVLWHRTIDLPQVVWDNLQKLLDQACPPDTEKSNPANDKPQIFPTVSSWTVNNYLSKILPSLTAKVFRTHHATEAVAEVLSEADVKPDDPEYKKWEAASRANLQAAILCNHTKKAPPSWPKRLERFEARLEKGQQRVAKYKERVQEYSQKLQELEAEAEEKVAARKTEKQKEKTRASYEKKIARAVKRVDKAQERLERAQIALGKIEAQKAVATENRAWNLGTSLKSYIDPRVYYRWGQEVDYDVLERYYPKKLRRKFAWVKEEDKEENGYL